MVVPMRIPSSSKCKFMYDFELNFCNFDEVTGCCILIKLRLYSMEFGEFCQLIFNTLKSHLHSHSNIDSQLGEVVKMEINYF